MQNIVLILTGVLLNCGAQLAIKKGMMGVGKISGGINSFVAVVPSMLTNIFLWIGMACYAISVLLWMVVLSRVDVSYAYPFLSIGYVISAVVGYAFLSENITPIRIVGIVVICIGVILISRS